MAATMTARFPGKCTSCGGRISVGATILWAKGEGARHVNCSAPSPSASVAVPWEKSAKNPANRRARLAIRAAVRGDDDLRRIGEDDDAAGFHGVTRDGRTYRTM
jgi:hypothetical protein